VDYDSIESMDVELVQEHIMALTQGLEVTTPVYNMKVLAFPPSRPPISSAGAHSKRCASAKRRRRRRRARRGRRQLVAGEAGASASSRARGQVLT